MIDEQDFSVGNLIEWLKTKPSDEGYDWMDSGNCLLGQWCKSKGLRGNALRAKSCELGEQEVFYNIALKQTYHSTFGSALKRALDVSFSERGTK